MTVPQERYQSFFACSALFGHDATLEATEPAEMLVKLLLSPAILRARWRVSHRLNDELNTLLVGLQHLLDILHILPLYRFPINVEHNITLSQRRVTHCSLEGGVVKAACNYK